MSKSHGIETSGSNNASKSFFNELYKKENN